jgi:hypothetical protein
MELALLYGFRRLNSSELASFKRSKQEVPTAKQITPGHRRTSLGKIHSNNFSFLIHPRFN